MVTIGRDSKNDIVLTDASVSGEHACIESIDGSRMLIRDRGTRSGTFLWRDGAWIQVMAVHLGPQDRIRFGNHEMSWQDLSGSSATLGPGDTAGKRPAGLLVRGKLSDKPVFENPKRNPITGEVEERDPEP
jgi:pSer/pThr/pTyr-binding forkhead associated (FHA) protein